METRLQHNRTERLVMSALMVSLVLLGTFIFRIPVPMTQGYVHLGDAMIFLGIMILGKKNGSAAAALGSALADILGGFAFWAPWTFAIKFAMAYAAGTVIERSHNKRRAVIPAMILGGIIMCAGYLVAERVMYGTWAAAFLELPWNIGQFASGIVISLLLNSAIRYSGISAN